ncbi:MAG: hypothetical protein IT372_29370 [Polyangiaceae bacterium]|nr:hypothetical protein [Polyangiaceae bacterium]
MMRRTIVFLFLAALCAAAAGCEPASYPGSGASDFVMLTGGGRFVTATVDRGGILGAEVNLGRFDTDSGEALRGTAFQQPVSLDIQGGRVDGIVGTAPFQVALSRPAAGAVRARGLVRGELSDYRIDDDKLEGRIGRCSYDLSRTSAGYEGLRSCGGSPETAQVTLGPGFVGWSGGALMAALGVLLSR